MKNKIGLVCRMVIGILLLTLDIAAHADLVNDVSVTLGVHDVGDTIEGAVETPLELYVKTVDLLLKNQNVDKPETAYSLSDLAQKVLSDANVIDTQNLPNSFDDSPYKISFDDLSHCQSQDAAIGRLNNFHDAMASAISSGQQTERQLDVWIQIIEDSQNNAKQLAELSIKAAAIPDIDDFFANKWYELDQNIIPALNRLHSALTKQRTLISTNLLQLQTAVSNLQSNLKLISPGSCVLAGSWSGTCNVRGLPGTPVTMTLVSSTTLSGSYLAYPMVNATLTNQTHIHFSWVVPPGLWADWDGNFSQNYTHITGTSMPRPDLRGAIPLNAACNLVGFPSQ